MNLPIPTYLSLPPATKLCPGNVFTHVCRSVQRRGVSVPACTTGHITGGLCPRGSLSGESGVSLWEVGVSVWGDPCLRERFSVQGSFSQGDPSGQTPYGNERPVRILLECILVDFKFGLNALTSRRHIPRLSA